MHVIYSVLCYFTGAVWSSVATPAETTALMSRLRAGLIKILYLSPERLLSPGFLRFASLSLPAPGVSLVCVDEAHCLSEWSHNFRPGTHLYLTYLPKTYPIRYIICTRFATRAIQFLPLGAHISPIYITLCVVTLIFFIGYLRLTHPIFSVLRAKCVLALTATATRLTEDVICRTLRIDVKPPSDEESAGASCVLRAAVGRPNLLLTASLVDGDGDGSGSGSSFGGLRVSEILAILQSKQVASITTKATTDGDAKTKAAAAATKSTKGGGVRASEVPSSIVYVATQFLAERVATELSTAGVRAEPYHAGLTAAQRQATQARFMAGKARVVVATIAFGMGLDKSDVRVVIHHSLPRTLENYVQVRRILGFL